MELDTLEAKTLFSIRFPGCRRFYIVRLYDGTGQRKLKTFFATGE